MVKCSKILLVYPPNQLLPIETPRPDGSLGPLYLAGALEEAGFETDILDASVGTIEDNLQDTFYRSAMLPSGLIRIGMSVDEMSSMIARGGYDIVCVSSNFTSQTRMALEVARAAKNVSKNILVIAGGVNARNLSERFLESGIVDAICLTEGEKIIVRMVEAYTRGKGFERVSGIAYQKDGKYFKNATDGKDIYVDLDELPFPAWHKMPFVHYDQIASPHGVLSSGVMRYAPIMTSRGCPFQCKYCHISTEIEDGISGDIGDLRMKSVPRVLEEISILRALGVKKLYFEDDSLLAKKSRVKEIFEKITGMGLQIANVNGVNLAHFQKRGDGGKLTVDVEYLEILKAAGFNQIVFPVESGSQRILDEYATSKLNLSTFNVIEMVRIAARLGIICPINMMIGFPDETEEEMFQSIALGKTLVENGAAYCTFFIPIPFPGSKLFQIAIDNGYISSNFDTDIMNWKSAVMQNTVVSPERIIEIRDNAWREANTDEHVAMRLKSSIGGRWQD